MIEKIDRSDLSCSSATPALMPCSKPVLVAPAHPPTLPSHISKVYISTDGFHRNHVCNSIKVPKQRAKVMQRSEAHQIACACLCWLYLHTACGDGRGPHGLDSRSARARSAVWYCITSPSRRPYDRTTQAAHCASLNCAAVPETVPPSQMKSIARSTLSATGASGASGRAPGPRRTTTRLPLRLIERPVVG